MGIIVDIRHVFEVFNMMLSLLPASIKALACAAFGGLLFIVILKSIRR